MRRNNRLRLEFFNKYKFPEEEEIGEEYLQGWFGEPHHKLLYPLVKGKKLILELGSWLGKSTIGWLENSDADVICVDTWEGSIEHQSRQYDSIRPVLKNTFLANLEPWKKRVFPLQMKTVNGIAELYKHNIYPDFIYIDASHEYEDVYTDLALCYSYFPKSLICGDDWSRKSQNGTTVRNAVTKYCEINNIEIINNGTAWHIK